MKTKIKLFARHHHWLFLVLAIFFIQHAVRDYLQIHNHWNFFTNFLHFWHSPGNETYSLVASLVAGLLAICLFWLGLKRNQPRSKTKARPS